MKARLLTIRFGKAVACLRGVQDLHRGNPDEELYFVAHADSGVEMGRLSESFTIAMALEAVCRYESEAR